MSETATPSRERQGARDLRARRRASAAGRERPDLDLRRRAADRDPRQGAGAHRALGLLVRADRLDRPQPPALRSAPTAARPTAGGSRCSRSSASCAATSRARAGRTTSRPARSAATACPTGWSSRSSCPSRSSRRRRRRRPATTRTSTAPPRSRSSARSASTRSSALTLELYRFVSERAAARGIILADTKLEFGRRPRGPARPRRRGVHARLVALLAGRRATSPAARSRRSTSSSSATTARRSAGTRPPRARLCPTTSSQGTRARYVEAFERLTRDRLRRLPRRSRASCSREGDRARPAEGRDPRPAGAGGRERACDTSASPSGRRGSAGSSSSTLERDDAGEARAQLERMCEQLLANPLIESYEIELHAGR